MGNCKLYNIKIERIDIKNIGNGEIEQKEKIL